MNKKLDKKLRLDLDTELIADLEAGGDAIKGGQSGSRNGGEISASFSGSIVVSRIAGGKNVQGGGGNEAC